MHVKAKSIAMSGIMLALTMLFMLLGNVLEMNTLFLLAAASYFNGIIFREFGGRMSAAFYLAGVLLGFIVSPNKLYVIFYAAILFAGKLTGKMLAVILLAGQAGLVVYDWAYEYVQGRIWTKYRRYFVSE